MRSRTGYNGENRIRLNKAIFSSFGGFDRSSFLRPGNRLNRLQGIPPKPPFGGGQKRRTSSIFGCATPLRPPTQLAERVEFPEEKREFSSFWLANWRKGLSSPCCSVLIRGVRKGPTKVDPRS